MANHPKRSTKKRYKNMGIEAPQDILAFLKSFFLHYSAVIHVKGRRDVLVYTGMYVV